MGEALGTKSAQTGQWAPAMGPGCKSMLKRSTCCEMQAAVLQINEGLGYFTVFMEV